jgi:hypothetical protein
MSTLQRSRAGCRLLIKHVVYHLGEINSEQVAETRQPRRVVQNKISKALRKCETEDVEQIICGIPQPVSINCSHKQQQPFCKQVNTQHTHTHCYAKNGLHTAADEDSQQQR